MVCFHVSGARIICAYDLELIVSIINKAIQKLGSAANLARAISDKTNGSVVTGQILNGWIKRNRVPDHMVWPFCYATGFMPWEVRPDLYDRPEGYLAKVARIVEQVEA